MNHLNDDYEKNTTRPEKIHIIGEDVPYLKDMYDTLSNVSNIKVFSEASSISKGKVRREISEKELVDNLLDFCSQIKSLNNRTDLEEEDREVVDKVDQFLDSVTYLSHEMYNMAIQGLARYHADWLVEKSSRAVRFIVHDIANEKSQGQIAKDIVNAIIEAEPELEGRATVLATNDLSLSHLDEDIKLVVADDWSVSGNLIAQDISYIYRHFRPITSEAKIEVNLLVARQDQVASGIHTIDRLKEDYPEFDSPTLMAYYSAPENEEYYGYKAFTSGSHSSVDYGFSNTLEKMYAVLRRYSGNLEVYMPYAAEIIPKYRYNYTT